MQTTTQLAYKGYTVTITSDAIWFTVYDSHGKPCGTIERPHRGHDRWEGFVPTGESVNPVYCAGPKHALRSIAIYHGA